MRDIFLHGIVTPGQSLINLNCYVIWPETILENYMNTISRYVSITFMLSELISYLIRYARQKPRKI